MSASLLADDNAKPLPLQSLISYSELATKLDASSMAPLPAIVALRTTEPSYGTRFACASPADTSLIYGMPYSVLLRYDDYVS